MYNKRDNRRGEIHEHSLNGQYHSAGRGKRNQAEVDNLEQGDAKNRLDNTRADDVRLGQSDLLNPAADVESVSEANQSVNSHKVNVGMSASSKPPREQCQGKDGDAVGRQGDGMIAKPTTAIGNIAVSVVNLEAVYLSEEQDCEQKVRELMCELHQPAHIGTDARDEEQGKEGNKSNQQVPMQ